MKAQKQISGLSRRSFQLQLWLLPAASSNTKKVAKHKKKLGNKEAETRIEFINFYYQHSHTHTPGRVSGGERNIIEQ